MRPALSTPTVTGAPIRLDSLRAQHLTLRRMGAALALTLLGAVLLVLVLVLVLVRRPTPVAIQTLHTGRWPDALLLDRPGTPGIVANDGDGTVSLLDLAHGRVLRTVAVADPHTLAPLALALDHRTHHLFVASRTDVPAPSVVQMLDSRSGARLATTVVGQEAAALAVDPRHERVLVADEADGTLTLLDARTGGLWRTLPLGLLPLALAVDAAHNRAFVTGVAPSRTAGLPAGDAGLLGEFDTRSGVLLRRIPLGREPSALAVDHRSARVFVACSGDATVRALDTRRGTLLGTTTLDAAPVALGVDERRERVYVVSTVGSLSLFDARSGRLLSTRRLDPDASGATVPAYTVPYALAVDDTRDRLYVTTWGATQRGPGGLTPRANGWLYVLDAGTGAVRRRIAVGVAPQAVAVQEGSGQVVVVNRGGVVAQVPDGWGEPSWIGWLQAWRRWLGRFATPPPAPARMPGSVSVLDPTGF